MSLRPWGLKRHKALNLKHGDWTKNVVGGWFSTTNTETADDFLQRAESFLQKSFKGESNGAKILYKVIQVSSYVAFFRMECLEALLFREQCGLRKRRHTRKVAATKQLEADGHVANSALLLPITTRIKKRNIGLR